MRRYLPLTALNTGLVIVLPGVLVATTVRESSPLLMAACAVAAVATSNALAVAGAALWKRQRRSRDIVFADLLLWGWLRRCWTERRLSQARALYDSARKAGPSVSIELLTGLSRLLEARDTYTYGHGQRVARQATRIARAMHLRAVDIAKIQTAATVHDVGKLYTPREILNNPGALSEEEYEVAKCHAAWGAAMLADVGDPEIVAMVLHHHERMDGHGYPSGLAGPEIPLGARIIAVADTFDAITSARPYRRAATQKEALDILSEEAGVQLDSDVVAAFLHTYSARRAVTWSAIAAALPARLLAGLHTAAPSIAASGGSLLAAVGAAGLLGIAPGPRHPTAAHRMTQPSPTQTRSARPGVLEPVGADAHGQAAPHPRGTAHSRAHNRGPGIVRRPRRTTSSPPVREPVQTGQAPSATPTDKYAPDPPRPPSTPTPPNPVTGGPFPEVPPPPAPPAGPQVTIPSLPPVTPPIVQVPAPAVPAPLGR